jgi:hypothetical protein
MAAEAIRGGHDLPIFEPERSSGRAVKSNRNERYLAAYADWRPNSTRKRDDWSPS